MQYVVFGKAFHPMAMVGAQQHAVTGFGLPVVSGTRVRVTTSVVGSPRQLQAHAKCGMISRP